MRFNLKSIFALTTLVCLGVLAWQQHLQLTDLHQQSNRLKDVQDELSATSKLLDVAKLTVQPDTRLQELAKRARENIKPVLENRIIEKGGERVALLYVPTEKQKELGRIEIFVPDSRKAFLEFSETENELDAEFGKHFQTIDPLKIELPSGISKLTAFRSEDSSKNEKYEFHLNGKLVHACERTLRPGDGRFGLCPIFSSCRRVELSNDKKAIVNMANGVNRTYPNSMNILVILNDISNGEWVNYNCSVSSDERKLGKKQNGIEKGGK